MPGIPALYYASHIDSTWEPLTGEDYALVREVWAEYRRSAAKKRKEPGETKVSELGGAFMPGTNPLVKRLALHAILPIATKPLKSWEHERLPGQV